MKKSAIIIITAALLSLSFAFGTAGCSLNLGNEPTEQYTIYQADGMKPRDRGKRMLLNELVEEDYHLYSEGEYVILVHDGQETEFSDWSRIIADETPDMYYNDFNGDGENELLIRALESIDEKTGESIYCLYALMPKVNENGEYKYTVCYGGRSSWHTTLSELVTSEMTQPVGCEKRLQLVMANIYETIAYDQQTGVLTSGRAWYAEALSDGKGNYYHLDNWSEGLGIYTVDEENLSINVEISIFATYKEVDTVQKIGHVNCGVVLKGSTFQIAERSVGFTTEEEYVVSNPRIAPDEPWEYTFENTSSYSSRDKVIDYLTMQATIRDDKTDERVSFADSSNDLRAIDRVVFADDKITFYAKSGYTFSETVVSDRNYSIIGTGNKTYEIAYSAAISEQDGVQTLVITLDKSYPKSEMRNMTIAFGE